MLKIFPSFTSCGHRIPKEMKLKQEKEEKINLPSNFCLPHSKIYTVDHLSSMLSHKQFLFTIYDRFMLLLLNFYISHVVFMFNIRGVEPVNIQGVIYFHPEVANMGMWNFYTSYKCLAQYFWYIVASQRPVLKLLPCLSKENCLHIGLSLVWNKRDNWFQSQVQLLWVL